MDKALKIDLVKLKETAKAILGKIAAALKAIAADLKKTCAMLAGKAGPLSARSGPLFQKVLTSIRAEVEKRNPRFFIASGAALFLLVLLVALIALNAGRAGRGGPVPTRVVHAIPVEELFIPDEPDFVPDFILEREPRHFWAIDDIRPYWRSPGSPDYWQGVIRSAVDELMENVP